MRVFLFSMFHLFQLSFCFSNASTAYIVLVMGSLFLSMFLLFTSFCLQLFGIESKTMADADNMTRYIFAIFPPFAFGRGMLDAALNVYYNNFFAFAGQWWNIHPALESGLLVKYICAMSGTAVICFLATIIIAYVNNACVLQYSDSSDSSCLEIEKNQGCCRIEKKDSIRKTKKCI
ncbi:hypothetical protein ANCCAN_13718 [Ancylostoma caninum]|uniref:Uncharacterized protein n=1 Tax=Ancylostoma caninum TaxID=29170 RepID=A0A368G7K3_ANCCA|nr:hypothetical protein ANCCAN_13718 [Ancylostoma caninum]